ncbi:ROK family glucokinase [Evansella cellulosilytica]|uniref:Glucokinase n=1 Tax=Evansella cellulosilytica (strain ATCC 21833 / DSM 2522 / FERM P-1141 / JCM 9156 / N-4) TaxID=649639 RepID=E6TWX8_EVAC2|nr:ROK family glucokinase [Evansella cellulosilytica]ADU29928.1 glucokinase, ROK family [Evansella cellulosilytica DSM 2522]
MEKNMLVGVDIGGTTVKIALIDIEGTMKMKWEINTNTAEHGKYIVSDIVHSVEEKLKENAISKDNVIGIGLGAPGFIDVEKGLIFEAVNLGWKDFALKEKMEEAIHIPTFVDNDANLAAVGEMWQGAGEGAENLLCVTLGTGVGGGVIAGGEIIHGQSGMAGEIGHIATVLENGAPCNCGKKGCLETVASATGIARLGTEAATVSTAGVLKDTLEANGALTAKDVFDAAKAGDTVAQNVVKEASHHLGLVLANLANALNPEKIVLGGGVSKAGDILVGEIKKYFTSYAIPKIGRETHIKIATLGNDAGVYGAAWLAKQG